MVDVNLWDATLPQIAAELRRRAHRTCRRCGGRGQAVDSPGSTAVWVAGCAKCNGTGYEPWPELTRVAAQLKQLVEDA